MYDGMCAGGGGGQERAPKHAYDRTQEHTHVI